MSPDHRSHTLNDAHLCETRSLQITPHPYFTPDNVIIAAVYRDHTTEEPIYYPVEVNREDLLKVLGGEPDETDYAEVLKENESLGLKLSKTLRERDSWKSRAEEAEREWDITAKERDEARAEKDDQDPQERPRDDPEEQVQLDRSWALEKAGEVLGRLAAVGALPKDWAGVPVIAVAEWILTGKAADRG